MQQIEKNYDIRVHKNNLRNKYKQMRSNFSCNEKNSFDKGIFNKIISLDFFKKAEIIYTFVSTKIEVDTKKLIEASLKMGKKVAVPKCLNGKIDMDFYFIKSFSDLEVATFNVLEPITSKCEKVEQNNNSSICIVPGLAFDLQGYRLGYGKGYYDRFLSNYSGVTFGICYCSCTTSSLPKGKYDKKVDYLVTEKYIKKIN